ncbi:MAG: hypothetical protein ACLVHV_11445 [Oscillospiraceae bacterium]
MAEKNRKDNPRSRNRTCPRFSRCAGTSWPPSKRRKDPFQQTKFTVSAHTQQIKDHFDQMEGQAVTVAGVSCPSGAWAR